MLGFWKVLGRDKVDNVKRSLEILKIEKNVLILIKVVFKDRKKIKKRMLF